MTSPDTRARQSIHRPIPETPSLIAALLALFFALIPAWAGADAPDILLAQTYRADVDVRAYLISEKFDGVRALWDGKSLRFRSGRQVAAPDWFLAGLPAQALDGELWLGRERFDELAAIVRKREPVDAEWRRVRYLIFELPDAPGDFRQRVARIVEIVAAQNQTWLHPVEQHALTDVADLDKRYRELLAAGAEGAMLHRADAPYLTGRSDVLLKLKPSPDAEATVVGYTPGRGKFAGLVGALRLRLPDGKEFSLGSGLPLGLRQKPPPLGTQITYRYQSLTPAGLPRFARYWRVREEF